MFQKSEISKNAASERWCSDSRRKQRRRADERLCFRYSDSTVHLLHLNPKFQVSLFCDCTGRFVSDMVGNHIVGFPTRRLIEATDIETIGNSDSR